MYLALFSYIFSTYLTSHIISKKYLYINKKVNEIEIYLKRYINNINFNYY